jgi:hypothetical protein
MMTEASDAASPASRPPLHRKDSRKVPGGFGTDDEDDLSPTKTSFFSESDWPTKPDMNSSRMPSLDAMKLPALPTAEDSSLLYAVSEGKSEMDSQDESEMRRHLMDVESSFLPAPSPLGQGPNPGVDDTFLFDGARKAQNTITDRISGMRTPGPTDGANESVVVESLLNTIYQTPAPARDSLGHTDGDDNGNTTSSLETMSSSPTAAAAARTVSRAISATQADGYETQGYETANDASATPSTNGDEDDYQTSIKMTPPSDGEKGESSDERSTIRYHRSFDASADAGSTPGAALLHRQTSGKRSRFLRSRHASQRSSISSFHTNPEDDHTDVTFGTDYALQSGGAVPTGGMSRQSSYMLSRTISLGSMASGIEDSRDLPPLDRPLETLDEERNRERIFSGTTEESVPETPRATTRQDLAAPTDTVIAQRVRNVQVPETLVKEYRNKTVSPGRISGLSAPSLGRSGKNMTLKEQSSTIERLSKENFDLKLKVMFLSDRLDKLSEEGVKEMVSENVEMKTALANMQRDNKALRRKVKELEQKQKEDGRPSTSRSGTSSDDRSPGWFDQEAAQEKEEELVYLRERIEEYELEIEKMRNESLNREAEKRKLAEIVRNMGEKRGENMDAREEMDVWKDLLEQETARREQADEDNKKLRDEIFRMKTETSSTGIPGLSHTTNIYNITKKRQVSPSRPRSGMSERYEERGGAFSAASTLVEDLRKESEQLRHENAELRREVGAQTSMLTSRNREKERLYQEIEDLKLGHRRGGGSIAGDSILERSASRAHERSQSRGSIMTKPSLADSEREDYENKNAELRDKLNALKLQNQELQRELDGCMEDFEILAESKNEVDMLAKEIQTDLEVAEADLQTMQADRDEALKCQEEIEIEFEALRKEAQEEIDALEAEAEQKIEEIQRLQADLTDRTENFTALQNEMRGMSEALLRLEDDHDSKSRRIQELEQDVEESNREIEEMEKALNESNNKINRLTVQQESSQNEIAFLREEQDGDKIKIGDLESAVKTAENSARDERERARELEQRLANERHQRDLIAGKEKQEVQKFINELNKEVSTAKDEARRLRKSLSSREVEATEWKERLFELENNLREALGDLSGTRSSLLKVWMQFPGRAKLI